MYQKHRYEQQDMRISVIIALVVHILVLLLLFFLLPDSPLNRVTDPSQEALTITFPEVEEHPHKEVAALKPRAGAFGATDQEAEELVVQEQASPQPQHETPHQEQPQEETVPLSEAHSPLLDKTVSPTVTKKADSAGEKKEQHPTTLTSTGQKESLARSAGPMQKTVTLKDLAAGFLASWQNDGNDWCERKGNENIRPDLEEMRLHSYLQKLIWHMQNMWHHDTTFRTVIPESIVTVGVHIVIDKEGKLKDARIIESCGYSVLDEAVVRGIKAVTSYPPIPAHLKKDELSVSFGLKIWGRRRSHFSLY